MSTFSSRSSNSDNLTGLDRHQSVQHQASHGSKAVILIRRSAHHYNRDLARQKILLVLNPLVDGEERIVPSALG